MHYDFSQTLSAIPLLFAEETSQSSLAKVCSFLGNSAYFMLAGVALLGLYHIVIIWTRVGSKRFKSEEQQEEFMDQIDPLVRSGRFEEAIEACEGDSRAVPQMVKLALENQEMGLQKVRGFVLERFRRDFMTDLEFRLSWVATVVKTAPMLGLFGTVVGMMGTFLTLASSAEVKPSALAGDIRVALETTVIGLVIAIPLILLVSAVNIRIAKLEDLVGHGLNRFFEALKTARR